ncbi:MAG: hybrid sensor histidine kinase/response regulator [Asticcacaulis sp.]
MNAFTPNSAARAPTPTSRLSLDMVVLDYGLLAQWRLSAYVIGFFGIGLPLFIWTASLSVPIGLLAFYIALFVINWILFMAMKNQAEQRIQRPATDAEPRKNLILERRWRQGLAGGVWALTLLFITTSAAKTGTHPEILLMICAGAAIGIIFFSAPVLIFLLIFGPLAVAGPIVALHHLSPGSDLSRFMAGGLALALALGFILNRHMQEHYLLQHNQLEASLEREIARADSQALNEAKVALMETLSREVRTGLKDIEQNLLQGLTHLTRAPSPRHVVDTALNAVGHLQNILITTLDNDTATTGHIQLDVQPLDINRLCQRMISQFQGLANSKGLDLSYNSQHLPEYGATLGDEHRVEQILAHLLSNALLYTQQGRVELKLIRLPDSYLRIEVVDSGPGLSERELDQAFMPHIRILRTSAGHSGAGLGLSLSRSLGTLMNGRTGAQSTPDVGSKFWLDLPFDDQASPPVLREDPEDTPAETGQGLRILLIANDSLRSAQLRASLEGLGHKCLTATTRERALILAKKARIDACVISAGTFDSLEDDDNRDRFVLWLDSLRKTQSPSRLNVLAVLPDGEQAQTLQSIGVTALMMPLNRAALTHALMQTD